MRVLRGILPAIILGATLAASAASAQEALDNPGRLLASNCFQCHGTNGAPAAGGFDRIAGESAQEIASELQEMRAEAILGSEHPIMTVHSQAYSLSEIDLISRYLSTVGATTSGSFTLSVSKTGTGKAFTTIHTNIDYYANAAVSAVTFDSATPSVKTVTLAAAAARTDPVTGTALDAPVSEITAAVVNLLPKMKGGQIMLDTLAGVEGAIVDGRWAKVNELSYETLVPGVHVIGDSIASKQPKAGHIGNQQGKVCADAILRLETGLQPYPAPVTNAACYTPITSTTATWLTAVFAYKAEAGEMQVVPPGVVEAPEGPTTASYSEMGEWFGELMADTFA